MYESGTLKYDMGDDYGECGILRRNYRFKRIEGNGRKRAYLYIGVRAKSQDNQ